MSFCKTTHKAADMHVVQLPKLKDNLIVPKVNVFKTMSKCLKVAKNQHLFLINTKSFITMSNLRILNHIAMKKFGNLVISVIN